MTKRTNFLLSRILGSFLVLSTFFISCNPEKYTGTSVFMAVPSSTALFVKINDVERLSQTIGDQNEWWKLLAEIKRITPVRKSIAFVDSMMNANQRFKDFLNGKEIILALVPGGKDETNYLLAVPMENIGDQGLAEDFINDFIHKNQLHQNKRKYEKTNLFDVTALKNNEAGFSYSFHNNLLIISPKSFLVEESLRQTDTHSLTEDPELAPLFKTTNNQSILNIFINHKRSPAILSSLFTNKANATISKQSSYSGWTELDVTVKDQKIFLSGFTTGEPMNNYFSDVLITQQPGNSKIESVLPSNTCCFSGFYLSDIEKFMAANSNYINRKNTKPQNQKELKDIEKSTGYDLRKLFVDIFDAEMAASNVGTDEANPGSIKTWTVKTKSGSYAINKLIGFQESYIKSINGKEFEWVKEFKIDNQSSIKFYKFPVDNLATLLFGNLLGNVNTSWVTNYNNYLIFTGSYSDLGTIVMSNVLGETLNVDNDYMKFQSGLTSKYNYFYFCNTSVSYPNTTNFFAEDISKDILKKDDFKKFKYVAWQISSAGNMLYNNGCAYYSPNLKMKPQTVWQSHLNASLSKKPLILENRYDTQNKDIILCDSKNNVYMLNNIGRILWQFNTESKILSDIQIIDYYKNGKYQLVFSTKEKLFIVDKKGNNIENFPIRFRVNATNGVSVFDYDKNQNYRFFMAGEDNCIYAYDPDGKLLDGWKPFKTDHPVYKPVQHFSVEGKDYIIASDRMKDYILDRRGNIRVSTDEVYQHSINNCLYLEKRTSNHEPRLVTTDSEGNIHRTYFNGKHEKAEYEKLDDNHFFVVENVDDGKEPEYIFTKGSTLIVTKNNGENVCSIDLNYAITDMPNIYYFSSNERKIGITCGRANKIFLLNIDGAVNEGFPLDGCSEFSIGIISDDSSNYNLLVGSPDGYLYNYYVKH